MQAWRTTCRLIFLFTKFLLSFSWKWSFRKSCQVMSRCKGRNSEGNVSVGLHVWVCFAQVKRLCCCNRDKKHQELSGQGGWGSGLRRCRAGDGKKFKKRLGWRDWTRYGKNPLEGRNDLADSGRLSWAFISYRLIGWWTAGMVVIRQVRGRPHPAAHR